MTRKNSLVLLAAIIVSLQAQAQLPSLEDVARTVVAPLTAPVETTVRILKGDDPGRAVAGPWQAPGRVVQRTSQSFQQAQDAFTRVSGDAIERNLGPEWRQGYNALTASQRVQFELTTTAGKYLGGCLRGDPCTLNQLVAGPLAAALRDAYKVYWSYSSPLPPQLVQALSRVVPPPLLSNARWVIGTPPDFTVPGFLNSAHAIVGRAHAVTIGNVMIFSRMPDMSRPADRVWLLHELRHIEQYMNFSQQPLESIDGFAVTYIQHYNSMESSAEEIAKADAQRL